MSFSWEKDGLAQEDDPSGGATLAAKGVFGLQSSYETNPPRRLQFTLRPSLIQNVQTRAEYDRLPKIMGLAFEVRPDLPTCLIGERAWEEVRRAYESGAMGWLSGSRRTLPSYDDLIRTSTRKEIWDGRMIFLYECVLEAPAGLPASERFDWGPKVPMVHFGVGRDLNPDFCCVGLEFLRHGMLCWKEGRTYFFPARVEHEIWSDFRRSRQFRIDNPTPVGNHPSPPPAKVVGIS